MIFKLSDRIAFLFYRIYSLLNAILMLTTLVHIICDRDGSTLKHLQRLSYRVHSQPFSEKKGNVLFLRNKGNK